MSPPEPLTLAEQLAGASHGTAGLEDFQAFLRSLSVGERVTWLAENLITVPLTHDDAQARAGEAIEQFNVLQGDVIETGLAYELGSRVDSGSFMVATSSCDLIPSRRASAILFPVEARRRSDFVSSPQMTAQVAALTLYTSKKYFYLPVMGDDPDDVVFNVAHLDPIAVISNEAINLSRRRGSLSLVGWRIFGLLARELLIREAEHEDAMRTPRSSSPAAEVPLAS